MLMIGDTLVVRWVDRLGPNYRDVCDTIREFMQRGSAGGGPATRMRSVATWSACVGCRGGCIDGDVADEFAVGAKRQ
jgi:hypothetical protein